MDEIPSASVTNCHKIVAQCNTHRYLSVLWVPSSKPSSWAKTKDLARLCPGGAQGGDLRPCLSQRLEASHDPQLKAPSSLGPSQLPSLSSLRLCLLQHLSFLPLPRTPVCPLGPLDNPEPFSPLKVFNSHRSKCASPDSDTFPGSKD